MRNHHPMQTDKPLQIMNSAVPATIQSVVEKRRTPIRRGSFVAFTFALGEATLWYRRLPAEGASAEGRTLPSSGNAARAGRRDRPNSPSSACSMNDSLFFAQFGGRPI